MIAGACLVLSAPEARAVAPIFTETPLRGTPAAASMLERLSRKPSGVDRAEAVRTTVGGQYKAIIILLQFPPNPAVPGDPGMLADTLAHPPAAYDSLLFSVGTQPTGSFRDFYREVSRGQFDVDGVVTRWYMAPHHYAYYANGQSGFGNPPNNAQQMAYDAVALADPDIDFRDFDNDGPDGTPNSGDDDGFVDALFVVHAGPGGEETASAGDIVSHKWNLPTVYTSPDGSIQALHYTTEPEKWAGLAPHTAPNQIMSIGTFCHEFGHILGLPDLYDTRSDPQASEGIGEWDVMASGSFNHAPGESLATSPAHMSAWSKATLGWVSPIPVAIDQPGVVIDPVETVGSTYRLWTDGDNVGEYFLIENRQPIGFDVGLVRRSVEIEGLNAHGLLIYHIDESVADNNNPARKLVDVEEAGGIESVSGPPGVRNLDLHRGSMFSQSACGTSVSVTGTRGDRYDPWPGGLSAVDFNPTSCPSSASYCGDPSQVAVRNIAENSGVITADLHVKGANVIRQGLVVDDTPRTGTLNNGNGRAETGESILLGLPLFNASGSPTPALYAKLVSLDSYTTVTAGDSIDYGAIGAAQTDSGGTVEVAVNAAPDPTGAWFRYSVFSPAGLVRADTVQLLLGVKNGLCDDFETGVQRWYGAPSACPSVSEWHRESGVNQTPGGAWAWKLGPVGSLGSYAGDQDSRLISPPLRLTGSNDTLSFWQRYDTQTGSDGLSVEISSDGGATWTLLHPVPDYPFTDRWSGSQPAFTQAKVPLTASSGVVQLAFRFRSLTFPSGLGWWIDDVAVNGDATCATTGADAFVFGAEYDAAKSCVAVRWDFGGAGYSAVGIDRAVGGGARVRIASPVGYFGEGGLEDRDLAPGQVHSYWVRAGRDGYPDLEYGPAEVFVPGGAAGAPRPPLALGRVKPNPFNPEASFSVTLDRHGPFALRVFRADGALVRTLHEGHGTAGARAFTWNGRDDAGAPLPSGVYLIELRSARRTKVEKAILLR